MNLNFVFTKSEKTQILVFTLNHTGALCNKTLNKASLILELKELKFSCISISDLTQIMGKCWVQCIFISLGGQYYSLTHPDR